LTIEIAVTDNTSSNQSDQWAIRAFERLKHDDLEPTPNNYAVYYYYFSGSNPNLKMAIDILLSQQGALTQENCSELYVAHLGLDAEFRILQETNAAIETEVNRVLETIDRATAGASQYSETLDAFSGVLSRSESLEQIRSSVTRVMGETVAIVKQNERLTMQLGAATQQLTELRYNFDQAHKELQIDPLTEVGNRKFFDRQLSYVTAEARDNDSSLALLMIDIDHFKKFNDTFGHLVGDQVLRLVARTMVENLKGKDIIARYGGEEFMILLPQTRLEDAMKVADHLRTCLGTKRVRKRNSNETLGTVTISIGATEYCGGEELENFIGRADSALYKAKTAGRNQVVSETLTPEEIAAIKARRHVL
jgi:diguanylate cyclase